MAEAVLGADQPRRVGDFVLRPAQREAVRAAEYALAEYGGALIADAPGTGKTVLALAIASGFDDVLIIAPAALREQWKSAAERAAVTARFATIESLSHRRPVVPAPLVIVDEAHQVRTPSTLRYRAVAELAMNRRLLLLTATPVVNARRDCDALLALFMGERAAGLSESARAAVILRLASHDVGFKDVKRLPELGSAADIPGIAEAFRELPPPLPVLDGAQATAIVRLTLAFAWASSLAALDVALRRRMERGRVLDEQLAAGIWPSRDTLRAWVLGDDATQLAFGFETPGMTAVPIDARDILAAHLAAVAQLRKVIGGQVAMDSAARARSLKDLVQQVHPRRVIVLAHSAVTVRALYAALRNEPGVVAITGARVQAAAGRWTREEVLRALGPQARTFDPRHPRGIRLLIATDILAEGVELQGASVLVHADPVWTPARMEQRVGRVARDGQREQVCVTQFAIPPAAEAMLRMGNRLEVKSAARVGALSAADSEALLRKRLTSWLMAAGEQSPVRVAAVRAKRCGFLALLRENGEAKLVAGVHAAAGWRVCRSPRALLRSLPWRDVSPAPLMSDHIICAKRVLRRWHRTRRVSLMAKDDVALPDSTTRALRRRLERWIAQLALPGRDQASQELGDLLTCVSALRGRGAEQLLKRLLREKSDDASLIVSLRALCRAAEARKPQRPAPQSGTGRLRLEALLILVAPPKAGGGSGPALP